MVQGAAKWLAQASPAAAHPLPISIVPAQHPCTHYAMGQRVRRHGEACAFACPAAVAAATAAMLPAGAAAYAWCSLAAAAAAAAAAALPMHTGAALRQDDFSCTLHCNTTWAP
uniref:Uncharacterized protein n=1 Tax=Tetradesmus obliquus TaxID=3088 RepID=A0A383WPW8_TETOB|eukprot:jgi/Sobl393_1/17940/SZX78746.1